MTTETEFDPNDRQPLDGEIDEVEMLKAELEQLKAQSLIERADLDNQRKRLAREIEIARKFANEKLLAELLPVFDSMEAGLAAAAADDPLRAGLELTLKQLHAVAEKHGLVEVAPRSGDTFNPEHHNAVSQQPAPGIPSGAVVQAFQKGYLLNDRLLRPAMVVVAP
jgi:Molecular chaperone GrpE (heat shock protein)